MMEMFQQATLTDALHVTMSALLVPTIAILMLLIVYAVYSIGSLIAETLTQRRDYRVRIPELVARLENASMDGLDQVIDESGLLTRQKDDARELVAYLYLPEEARIEVAKRLLANENLKRQRVVDHTDMAAKVSPMLGLMGTLIPLGPGIIALGTGDIQTLSDSLLIAFDTTVAGLATAVVCFFVSRIRKRWYADYDVSMEAVLNTLLEKAQMAHEAGYPFERIAVSYGEAGKRAQRIALEPASSNVVPQAAPSSAFDAKGA